jgi:hypothetical protein
MMSRLLAVFALSASMAWAQRPSETEAAAIFEKARDRALAYARSLPDFICTEVVHRFSETRAIRRQAGSIPTAVEHRWVPSDKLTIRLSYSQHKEEHKLLLLDDKPSDRTYENLSGGTGTGEFGGTLLNIFTAESQTSFKWQSWKTVRRHRAAVFTYSVDAAHSRYMVLNALGGDNHEAVVSFHGDLEVDRETGEILHFTYVADRIPKAVNLDLVSTTVDYDFADVGGRNYLLPAHSATEIISPRLSVLNDANFREYRKFSADSVIDFGTAK